MSEILTVQEVCEYLKISKPSLYRYVKAGELPGFKMGKIWKFHRHTIDDWFQKKVVEDTRARSKIVIKNQKKKTRQENL